MAIGGRRGNSWRTEFAKVLESRPIVLHKRGPNKGQPKLCTICGDYVRQSAVRALRCPKHLRELMNARRAPIAARARDRRAAEVLGIGRPLSKPLTQYKARAQRKDYKGLFGHIPDNYQDIAKAELAAMLLKRPNPTIQQYAAMVACATAMAKYGGRRQWAKAMFAIRMKQALWRKILRQP